MRQTTRTPTVDPTVDRTATENRPAARRLGRAGLLLAVYAASTLSFAAIVVGGALAHATAGGVPMAGQLVLWLLAIAGVAVAPIVGQHAVRSVADPVKPVAAPLKPLDVPGPVDAIDLEESTPIDADVTGR